MLVFSDYDQVARIENVFRYAKLVHSNGLSDTSESAYDSHAFVKRNYGTRWPFLALYGFISNNSDNKPPFSAPLVGIIQ